MECDRSEAQQGSVQPRRLRALDELATNDLLKLRLGASLSPALKQLLSQANTPASQSVDVLIAPPQTFRLPWQ